MSLLAEQIAAQVSVAPITGDENQVSMLQLRSNPQGSCTCTTTAHTNKYPFFPGQRTSHLGGLPLRYVDDPINARRIINLRKVGFRPASDSWNRRIFGWLAPDDLNRRIPLFQIHGTAHDATGGTNGTDNVSGLFFRFA